MDTWIVNLITKGASLGERSIVEVDRRDNYRDLFVERHRCCPNPRITNDEWLLLNSAAVDAPGSIQEVVSFYTGRIAQASKDSFELPFLNAEIENLKSSTVRFKTGYF